MGRGQLIRLTLIGVVVMLLGTAVAQAGIGSGVAITPSCTGMTTRAATVTANRDNTGRAREAFVLSARDGSGKIVFEEQTVYPINQRLVFAEGEFFEWQYAPEYNPIVVTLSSPAGNGQPEQIIFTISANCGLLPVYGTGAFFIGDDLSLIPIFAPADGRVSVPYDPNAIPPRPVNPPALIRNLPGYLIVNTDNLFLRTGDGVEYAPVGIVDGGTFLAPLGSNGAEDPDELWWYVEVGGLRGWVKNEFVIIRGDLSELPDVPVLGVINVPVLYVGGLNPIYNTPNVGGRYLCQIEPNRLNTVIAQDADPAAWYQIEALCGDDLVIGWIQADRGLLRNPAGLTLPIAP